MSGHPDPDIGHCVVSVRGVWQSSPCEGAVQFCQVESTPTGDKLYFVILP